MSEVKRSFTIEELAEIEECPCQVCTSQDESWKIEEREKIDEAIDLIANEMIDYLLKNSKEDILKSKFKQDNVE